MDLSKAFDMVEWGVLFQTLQARNVALVFLRTLLYVYTAQSCDVKWNGAYSHRFPVTNGVRQGAVSFPTLFSVYINDLFKLSGLCSEFRTVSLVVLAMQMICFCCLPAGLAYSQWSRFVKTLLSLGT